MKCLSLSIRLALIAVSCLATVGFTQAADRPNFVFVISEDNSKHFLELFDENGAPTPNIEKMAEHGLCFDRAFSNAPVCSVARSTLETSCFGPRIGIHFHRKEVAVPLTHGTHMFPYYLRQAGYYTTNCGKTDYNMIPRKEEDEKAWNVNSNKATWKTRAPGQPFFHKQSSYPVTHESRLHFPEADVQNVPTETDPESVFIPPYHPKTETFKYTYARYHDRIKEMDGQIGQMIADLEAEGVLEDTFIFYFGDHGGVLPRGKGYIFESGLHVPLVVRVPENFKHLVDAELGSRADGFVSFIDLGPTLMNLAGVQVPDTVDGRPFLGPGVPMEEVAKRDTTFGYADRFDEKYDLVRTMRKGKFKYMRSYQPFNFDALQNDYRYKMAAYREWRDLYNAGQLNEAQSQFFLPRAAEALYDIDVDPHEVNNLADDPAYADVLAEMRAGLQDWVKGMPDLSFYPESYLAKTAFVDGPIAFGQEHKDDIARLVDIADLSLLPLEQAMPGLQKALASDDPWQRYWGLISAASLECHATSIVDKAMQIAATDPEPLVRVRAAEYLALIGAADPQPVILDALIKSTSPIEANLILNTAVMLKDGKTQCEFDFTAFRNSDTMKNYAKHRYVNDRLNYIEQ